MTDTSSITTPSRIEQLVALYTKAVSEQAAATSALNDAELRLTESIGTLSIATAERGRYDNARLELYRGIERLKGLKTNHDEAVVALKTPDVAAEAVRAGASAAIAKQVKIVTLSKTADALIQEGASIQTVVYGLANLTIKVEDPFAFTPAAIEQIKALGTTAATTEGDAQKAVDQAKANKAELISFLAVKIKAADEAKATMLAEISKEALAQAA